MFRRWQLKSALITVFALGLCTIWFVGCSQESDETDLITRDELATGFKADSTLAERFCKQHGEPAWCDPCEVGNFYGDGECDLFCSRDDREDCGSTSDERCEIMSTEFTECTHTVYEPQSCIHEEIDYDLRACCKSAWAYSYCPVVAPVEREDLNWVGIAAWRLVQVNDLPAGQSGQHRFFAFDAKTFSAKSFAEEIRSIDKEIRGCADRRYSKSAQDGVALYEAFLTENNPFAGDQFRRGREYLTEIFNATDNLGVFASVPDSLAAECQYYDFYALSASNTGAHVYFDDRQTSRSDQLAGPSTLRYVDAAAAEIAQVQDEYAGNGSGAGLRQLLGELDYELLRRYAISSFINLNDHCFEHRFAQNTQEAIELFDFAITDMEDWIYEDEWPNWDEDSGALRDFIKDPDTVAVMAAAYDEELNDNSEACYIHEFYIVRANGTVLSVEYNFTD